MSGRGNAAWFAVVTIILILFGLLFVLRGLSVFAALIPPGVLLPWESALYGSIMVGWGVTLLLAGRIAFQRGDTQLKRTLLIGVAVWLAIEAAASAWFGVWFNVGVDIAVLFLFSVPLLRN